MKILVKIIEKTRNASVRKEVEVTRGMIEKAALDKVRENLHPTVVVMTDGIIFEHEDE